MSRVMRPWILLLPILLPACAASQGTGPRAGQLVTAIAEIRAESGVPALGAAVTSPDRLLAVAVDGVRKIGTENPVRISDAFHIGSVAKTMTATLAAQLVESGALAWNTRVAEMLPEEMARARDPADPGILHNAVREQLGKITRNHAGTLRGQRHGESRPCGFRPDS